MIIINPQKDNYLEWIVYKGLSRCVEDFTRSKLMLFAVCETNKIPLEITSADEGCVKANLPKDFELPTGHTEQTYDTELIWIKNGRDVNRTYQYNVFKVDTESGLDSQTIKIKSTAYVYGYDGLSSYELAYLLEKTKLSLDKWVENASEANEKIEDLSDKLDTEIDDRTTADTNLLEQIRILRTSKADQTYVDSTFATKDTLASVSNKVLIIESYIPEEVNISNKLADKLYVNNSIGVEIAKINRLIPTTASPDNKLADKDFVNSSVSTATADFKGTYNDLEDLEQVIATANDYAFVIANDAEGNVLYKRYKWVEGTGWAWEYDLNNSSFTAAQWAAINSNITSNDVEKLSALPSNAEINERLNSKANASDVYTKSEIDNEVDNLWDLFDVVENTMLPLKADLELITNLTSDWNSKSMDPTSDNKLTTQSYVDGQVSTKLSLSGGKMSGDIDLDDHALLVRHKKLDEPRRGIQFTGSGNRQGIYVGDGHMNLILESSASSNLWHKYGDNYVDILTSTNTKRINGNSIYGSGNIDINNVFKVIYGETHFEDTVDAYNAGKFIYAEDENGIIYNLYRVSKDDNNNITDFAFINLYGDGNDVAWFEYGSFGFSELYEYTLQTYIDDLSTIRSGAAAGATAQPQTAISDVQSGTTTLDANVDTYYNFLGTVDSCTITLPLMTTATTTLKNIIFNLTCGDTPAIVINGAEVTTDETQDVVYFANYLIEANKSYEINALWNGSKWVIGAAEITIPTEVEEVEE